MNRIKQASEITKCAPDPLSGKVHVWKGEEGSYYREACEQYEEIVASLKQKN
jgi:hypothetical protein